MHNDNQIPTGLNCFNRPETHDDVSEISCPKLLYKMPMPTREHSPFANFLTSPTIAPTITTSNGSTLLTSTATMLTSVATTESTTLTSVASHQGSVVTNPCRTITNSSVTTTSKTEISSGATCSVSRRRSPFVAPLRKFQNKRVAYSDAIYRDAWIFEAITQLLEEKRVREQFINPRAILGI